MPSPEIFSVPSYQQIAKKTGTQVPRTKSARRKVAKKDIRFSAKTESNGQSVAHNSFSFIGVAPKSLRPAISTGWLESAAHGDGADRSSASFAMATAAPRCAADGTTTSAACKTESVAFATAILRPATANMLRSFSLSPMHAIACLCMPASLAILVRACPFDTPGHMNSTNLSLVIVTESDSAKR